MPEGSEAVTLDIDSAFRCCPITPSQQCNFIVHWDGSFYINHNAPFGATSSGGIFSRIADAKSVILESQSLGPSKNWSTILSSLDFPYQLTQAYLPSHILCQIFTVLWHASDGHGNFPRRDLLPLSSST